MVSKQTPVKAGKVLDMMGSLHESFTPSARRISEFVMKKPADVTKFSIAELSQAVNAGEATIIRFCRTLGFKGFQDFKMELAIELSNQNQSEKSILDTDVTPNDHAELIGQKLQNTLNNVLTETLNLLNFESLEQVAEQIRQCNAVYFFGVGSSGITAEDAKNKFMRIGYNVDALTNNHFMYMKASLLKEGDLAIGISHSGNSAETTKAMQLAKEAGAKTVALTHNPRSSVCEYADWVLVNGNRQGQLQGDSIGTKITQLFVIDLIYTLLVKDDVSGAQAQKLKTTKALET
ncbi:MurR/RpiR family transcriptional regulator [Photobacterium sanctipauli]|uniref:MurR/RpiR family transcriptional regulator n=1 Tax=Photobacterium sanctipauli TaxID=1342794 RepID=A0A2T3NUN5_9GAMM|nr:MurR/RpiR family transcriptional regulator [Photobacterium sanctipauli]PSW19929.1 MurR/RpiR family transcriptional regulator [Photobacterium sanctipauli]